MSQAAGESPDREAGAEAAPQSPKLIPGAAEDRLRPRRRVWWLLGLLGLAHAVGAGGFAAASRLAVSTPARAAGEGLEAFEDARDVMLGRYEKNRVDAAGDDKREVARLTDFFTRVRELDAEGFGFEAASRIGASGNGRLALVALAAAMILHFGYLTMGFFSLARMRVALVGGFWLAPLALLTTGVGGIALHHALQDAVQGAAPLLAAPSGDTVFDDAARAAIGQSLLDALDRTLIIGSVLSALVPLLWMWLARPYLRFGGRKRA